MYCFACFTRSQLFGNQWNLPKLASLQIHFLHAPLGLRHTSPQDTSCIVSTEDTLMINEINKENTNEIFPFIFCTKMSFTNHHVLIYKVERNVSSAFIHF